MSEIEIHFLISYRDCITILEKIWLAYNVSILPTARLLNAAVHVKIHVAASFRFALDERVRMQNIDKMSIRLVQLLVSIFRHE